MNTIDIENDVITYSIDRGPYHDGSKYLRIDERTGDIYLKESLAGQVSVRALALLLRSEQERGRVSKRDMICISVMAKRLR